MRGRVVHHHQRCCGDMRPYTLGKPLLKVLKVPLALVVACPVLRLADPLGSLHPSVRGDRMHQYQARAVA